MIKNKCDRVIRVRISSSDLDKLIDFSKKNNLSLSRTVRLLIRKFFTTIK